MQSLDEEPNEEEKLEKLDQDYDKPFSPPGDIPGQGRLRKDDPAKDTGTDEDEWYQEGGNAAAGQPDNPKDEPPHGRKLG